MAAHLLLQLLNIAALLAVGSTSCDHTSTQLTEYQIQKHILCAYSTNIPPVTPDMDVVVVRLTLMPEFIEIDEYTGEIMVHASMVVDWTDRNLTWNPLEHKNVSSIYIDPSLIWTPEFINTNLIGQKSTFFNPTKCFIQSAGIVICSWLSLYQTGCVLDYTNWPFDKQYCDVELGEYIKRKEVNFTISAKAFVMKWFTPSRTWVLIDKNVTITSSSFKYGFTLQRHSGNYAAAFAYPVVCVIILTLMPYLMQPNKPRRILLSTTGIAGNILLLKGIGDVMWLNSSTTPRLVYFFRNSVFVSSICLFISLGERILILSKLRPPEWLTVTSQKLFNIWNSHGIAIYNDKPLINHEYTSSESYWHHIITIVDGTFLSVSCITYIVLILITLPGYFIDVNVNSHTQH